METSSNYSQSKDEQEFKKKVAAYLHIHEMDKNQWDWNVLIQQE